jgi:N-acetylneuraminic acid mutarotase
LFSAVFVAIFLLTIGINEIPIASATQETSEPISAAEKSIDILQDIVGIDVPRYNTKLDSYTQDLYLEILPQENVKYAFESEESTIEVISTFVNGKLRTMSTYILNGTPQTIQPSTDMHGMAHDFLTKYLVYSGDSYYATLKGILDNVEPNKNSTQTIGNVKLEVIGDESYTSFRWTYIVEAVEDSWETKVSMPTERHRVGVAVVNGKIYAIGGNQNSEILSVNQEYDPVTNTWSNKKAMPTPRTNFGIAVVENKIYVIGGETGEGYVSTGVNEVYDPATDSWETKTSMPTPRSALEANVVDGKIYLVGGTQNVNEVYDPATDAWETKSSMPTGVRYYASAVVNNKIYFIGGAINGTLNQIYDPETDTWSFGASLPVGVDSAAAGATTGTMAPQKIYVIGGKQNLDAVNFNQVYDPETDTWSTGEPLPTRRFGLGVAVVNDSLYAIGGVLGWFEPVTALNEQYTPFGYGTETSPSPSPSFSSPSENNTEPLNTGVVTVIVVAAVVVVLSAIALIIRRKSK